MAAVDSFYLLYREIVRSCNCYVETLALVGAVYTVSKSIAVVRDCYILARLHFIPRLISRTDFVTLYGKWAVISGSVDGIGQAYAEELARQGVNIIIISQNRFELESAAKAIAEAYRVETDVIEADFSKGQEIYKSIKESLKDKEIGILVNNVGVSCESPQYFTEVSEDKLWDIINTNIAAASIMAHIVLPGMAYLDHFSRSLHYEYASKGIFVQSLLPFSIASQMTTYTGRMRNNSWLVPAPQVYARHAVSTLGISHRTTGYWPHSIQFSADDEAELQSLLRHLLKSVKERISGAPSVECAEEILLHLEETDEHFHNYEFIRYLRHYVESVLGSVIEKETESCTSAEGQAVGSGQDTLVQTVTRKTRESNEYKKMVQSLKNTMMVVVESLINKFEEDQMRKEEMHRKNQHEQHSSHYTDNCSDSDSSFNQSYTFIKQEQLQVIAEKLDPSHPKEVRWDALQTLCCAPPSDVINCESWTILRKHLSAALADPDSAMSIVASLQQCIDYLDSCSVYNDSISHVQHQQLIDPVTLMDFIVMLIRIMYKHPNITISGISHADSLSPTSLVMEVLRTLCDRKECAIECMYTIPVIESLLSPIIALLKGKQVDFNRAETTLTHVADILARIATTERGLSLFLYEENNSSAEGESISAAHVIVQFTRKLLVEKIPALSESTTLTSLKGAFIFVCRQMYNTCEGLQVLKPYGLHDSIVQAWKKFLQKLVFCVYLISMVWEETLLDNLLNFAATPKGLLLLQQTGATNECVTYMFSRFTKKLQAFLALVNLLSSYQAVYELISKQELPNKPEYPLREMPTSIIELPFTVSSGIAWIRTGDFQAIGCFVHSERSAFTGYTTQEPPRQSTLLEIHSHCNPINQAKDFIIDGLSVERNHILVRVNLVGGPSERFLPPRALQKGIDPYPWPMFSSYPLPKSYIIEVPKKSASKQDSEICKFLASSKNSEKQTGWLEHCKKQFCKTMMTKPDAIRGNVLADLLEKIVMHRSVSTSECFFAATDYKAFDSSVKNQSLSSVDKLGIQISVRYGKYLNLLKEDSEQDLCLLMKHCCLQGDYPGYDWFSSSVFLIMSGDKERALKCLLRFSNLLVSAFLWLPRLHASIHLPVEIAESGIHPVYSCTAHYIEMLLKTEVPLVFSAFRMSGFTPSQICQQWLAQCFWNYLDWTEICHYIATCIILGPDYQIYICIAVLKHLQQEILQHTQTQDLQVFLKEEAIPGFHVSNYLAYMERLEQTYRSMVLTDMRNIKLKIT
ncbi:UNVERIFIED_CONTAM: hypothetical protein FKN15_044526 [Acipenser sinensis]